MLPEYMKNCNYSGMTSQAGFIAFIFCTNIITFTGGECGIKVLGMQKRIYKKILSSHCFRINIRKRCGVQKYKGYSAKAQRNSKYGSEG